MKVRVSPGGVLLPRAVYEKNGALYRVKANKWQWLCLDGDPRALADTLSALEPAGKPRTLGELLTLFVVRGLDDKAPKTRTEYRRMAIGTSTSTGRLMHHFGHMKIDDLTTAHVAQFLQLRADEGAATMGNRERACLSSAFEFAMRRGYAKANPCRGVRRNRERASRVYVEHADLVRLIDDAPGYWQPFFQSLYLTGFRVGDLVELEDSNLYPDGIRIVESKNRVFHFKEWSPTLRAAVDRALEHRREKAAEFARPEPKRVFTGRYGQPLTYWAVASQMARQGRPFELRQLRAKAETDRRGTIGHSGQMQQRYTRSVRTRPVK